jgi:UDP-glucose 4-epimerase
VALRYGNVYGPRQDSHGEAGVVAIFCERVLAGQTLTVFGDGNQTRDYVYVADVANANILAATRPLPPAGPLDSRSFNIGTGVETTVVELAELIRSASGSTPVIEHAPERAGEVRRSVLLASRAEKLLGWTPRMSIADGISETFRWFANERDGVASTT